MTGTRRQPPIWVLSLEAAAERRRRLVAHLEELGLTWELQVAVDGESLSAAQLATCYDPVAAVEHTGEQLSVGQIGAALSHRRLWRRMLEEGLDEVLILEDDAVPGDALPGVLEHRNRLPEDWDVVLLYHPPARPYRWFRPQVYRHYRVQLWVGRVAGAVAYLLRAPAARVLLEAATPVRVPADYLTGGWLPLGLARYGIFPRCVDHAEGPSSRSPRMPRATMSLAAARQHWAATRRRRPRWLRELVDVARSLCPIIPRHERH